METSKITGNRPKNHYGNCIFEPIDVIEKMLTPEQFDGFLLGNSFKYRLRAGYKDDPMKDITKALQYESWYKNAHRDG